MKEIKDYLPLYIGCKVYHIVSDIVLTLTPMGYIDLLQHWDDPEERQVKLLLRPLSSMTEDEANETEAWLQWTERNLTGQLSGYDAEQIRKMLLKSFDLFNLIEENLAIDATKVKR